MNNINLSIRACGGFECSREDKGPCFDVAMLPYPSTPMSSNILLAMAVTKLKLKREMCFKQTSRQIFSPFRRGLMAV